MSTTLNLRVAEARRMVSFRLSDIPQEIRQKAVERYAKQMAEDSTDNPLRALGDVALVKRAAALPSDRVYWVTAEAWDRVMGRRLKLAA